MGRDKQKLRKYQREWIARRRRKWFEEHGPCVDCGSWEKLELDHRNPSEKVSHSIWSWSQERRDVETAKCDVRCQGCHKAKTRRSKDNPKIVLTEELADEIRRLRAETGKGAINIAKQLGLSRGAVDGVIRVGNWK